MSRPTPPIAALLVLLAAAPAAGESFIIVNPAGRGNQSKAQAFLADFARALSASWPSEAGAPPEWTGRYHVHQADALASIRGTEPVFGLLSPGFYLAVRDAVPLEPRLLPVLADGGDASRVHLVVVDGSEAQARVASGSVAGLRLGGQLAGEPRWTRRVLLDGLAGAEDAVLEPQARTLQAVRALRRAECDAVLLIDDEWRRLEAVGLRDGLASARVVGGLLPGPLALIGLPPDDSPEPPEERARHRRALGEAALDAIRRFPETEPGRAVLETMGLSGFAPVAGRDYDRVAALYLGGEAPPESP
jgi:hypothetical protein